MCDPHDHSTCLRHDAFVYGSDDDFARLAPFLEDAVDAGEAAVAVTTRGNCAILREALGSASEQVTFVDRDDWYVHPARTIAGWDRTLRTLLRGGAPSVRAVGEVQFGSTPREWEEWTVYEAILNRALAHHPAWVVCPYDSRSLPAPVVERAAQTHPELLADGWRDSAQYDDPARLAQALAPEPEPVRELQAVPIDENLCTQRDQLAEALTAAGAPPPRVQDMLAAAGEVLANAAHHADGARTIRVGAVGDRFVCEISDSGRGHDDPLAGYLPPGADTTDGAGLWVARQVSSSLDLISSAEGLTVRIWV